MKKLFYQAGEIDKITFPRYLDTGKPRGFCFVQFKNIISKKNALKMDGIKHMDRELIIRENYGRSLPKLTTCSNNGENSNEDKKLNFKPEKCRTIFVGNLPFSSTEKDMMMLFLHCGNIQNIRVVRQFYTGRSRGFCYVEFENEEAADKGTRMNGEIFQDRILKVDYAHEYQSHGKNDPYKQINLEMNHTIQK